MIQEYSSWLNESQDNFLHLLTPQQWEWCDKHIGGDWKVNEKGEVYTRTSNITFKDKSFQRFEVQFADIEGYFDCERCPNLISLEGSPKSVGDSFDCEGCPNLISLYGSPIKVGAHFDCSHCPKLTSLVGGPEEVGSNYYCHDCLNLVSLKGAPEYINDSFLCYKSPNLVSLNGAPKEVGDVFDCSYCHKLNPKEVELTKDKKLFKIWLKAGTPPIDEFLDPRGKWRGVVTGRKFGI